ncbi:hypothetical protein Tco_0603969 [Tanacetum coccineum]
MVIAAGCWLMLLTYFTLNAAIVKKLNAAKDDTRRGLIVMWWHGTKILLKGKFCFSQGDVTSQLLGMLWLMMKFIHEFVVLSSPIGKDCWDSRLRMRQNK